MSRLRSVYWRNKARVVKSYFDGLGDCQQLKDSNPRKLEDNKMLDILELEWGLPTTDVIVGLPKKKPDLMHSRLGLLDNCEGCIRIKE